MTDNNIDILMSLDPLAMTPDDISAIIAYHRRNRANHEAGVKPQKEAGPTVKLDLVSLGLAKPAEPFKRRF